MRHFIVSMADELIRQSDERSNKTFHSYIIRKPHILCPHFSCTNHITLEKDLKK